MDKIKIPEHPWANKIEDVLIGLKTKRQGLLENEISDRLKIYGKNIFHKQEKRNALSIFFKQLYNPLIFILIGAVIITAFLNEWVEVVVISLAVIVNAGLGFYREYHAENTLEKLSSFIKDRARVIRDNREQEIDSEFLVPGDIVKLSYGSRVPADVRIISVNNLRIDEAILTGESLPIEKSINEVSPSAPVADRLSMAHAGTLVIEGYANAVVVAIGDKTEIGKIAGLVSGTHRAITPIQKGFSKLAWIIFSIVLVIVIGIFALGIYRGEAFFEMLILSVAVSVGAVPEALPIALTVILSIGAERIAKKKGIVRTLVAAETLGSTTLIMTDKTGTLTEANMSLVGVYSFDDLSSGNFSSKKIDKHGHDLIETSLANIDITLDNAENKISDWTFKGKPFEVNIVKTAREQGIDISRFKLSGESTIIIPFNSTHKFSLSSYKNHYTVMGAPDILLARSKMDAKDYKIIEDWIASTSSEGKRLIALGKLSSLVNSVDKVKDIEFLGILAFHDPIRKEVPASIRKIEALGIRIVMITGDIKGTAMAVAKEIGWKITDGQVLTGPGLQTMSDEELLSVLPTVKIFARVTPEDKLRVGLLYRKLGEIVAMTGDGVNDAPSLKAMDIGVALGSGSDVAKSAADLVLLNDNFQTISLTIQEGRRILVNIRKTFVYLMSNSLDEVFVIGGSLLFGLALPITALQIIWVNLFTGSLPALAFAYDDDLDHETNKNNASKTIFTREVSILTFGIGIFSSLLLFLMYYFLINSGVELQIARSVFFVCFASYILVIAYSFRSLHKPLFSYPTFSNIRLNISVIIAVLLLIMTMSVPFLREIFGIYPMPLVWLWFVLGWLVLNVLLVEGAKYFFRMKISINKK